MISVRRIELLALDMAGTTIDERGAVYRVLEASVRSTGAEVAAADLNAWMGTDKRQAVTELIRLGGREPTPEVVERTFRRFQADLAADYRQHPPSVLPGVGETLADLRARGIKIALTTGFSADIAEPLLQHVGWRIGDDLDAVITSNQVAAGRPAPYLIFRAMEGTRTTDVRQVLAAGDTVNDLRAARNAGVVAVGVCTGALSRAELAAEDHDLILESAAELAELLADASTC
jgi:phosphoglycolate phosphatase